MKWYRFWKKVQGHDVGETYRQFSDKFCEDVNNLKEEAQYWADEIPGGENYGYKYGFEEVEKPPKEYIIREIGYTRRSIANLQKKLEDYEFVLKTYSVKAKIDKIKDNIEKE